MSSKRTRDDQPSSDAAAAAAAAAHNPFTVKPKSVAPRQPAPPTVLLNRVGGRAAPGEAVASARPSRTARSAALAAGPSAAPSSSSSAHTVAGGAHGNSGNGSAAGGNSTAATAAAEAEEAPKVIMSKAQRRRLKKPQVVVTAAMRQRAKEERREIRKFTRALKANGSRRKIAKLREQYAAKRAREENEEDVEFAFSEAAPSPRQRRRLE